MGYNKSIKRLKAARDKLLDLHKLLIDSERALLEKEEGSITPSEFLGLLMNDAKFEWLRAISKLVVRIDESFELDDGMPENLLEKLTTEVYLLVDDSPQNAKFKARVEASFLVLPAARAKRDEIRGMFD